MDEAEDALRAITAGEIDAFVVSDGESGQRVFSLMRDAFFTLDVGWRYTYLNDQALELTARTRDEVLGRTIWEVSPALVGSPAEEVYRRVAREQVMVEFEEHDVPRDLWVSIRVYPTPEGIAVYAQDSTERKQLEARLLQSQKLEVVGQLASGIAHDFNNLLMVVDAYASLAQSEIDPAAESLGRSLQKIRAAAASGSALTAKLLAFSRTQASSSTAVDVNAVVSSALDLVAPLIGERIEVHRRLDPDAGCALLDAAQMEQVIVNLAVNARDAMGGTGNLYVETHGIDRGADFVAGMRHGPYVSISVRDDGCGMDEQTLKQIFDPFFTTKPVGEGTGLGLSTADATVRQCGGEIDAISAPGEGTTFTIYVRGSGETVAAPELLGAISQ